jgi:hypothetical protein
MEDLNEFDIKILEETKCIDNFVKEVQIQEVTDLWLSLCYNGFSLDRMGFNTSISKISDSLYRNYQKFIFNLSPVNKIKYINFYEKYYNKMWTMLVDQHIYTVRKDLQDLDYMYDCIGSNRWWEDAYSTFSIKN